jgi:hypothetical protein
MGGTSVRSAAAVLLGIVAVVAVASALAKEPEVTYQFPPDGTNLEGRPTAIQLCFSGPIDVRDLDTIAFTVADGGIPVIAADPFPCSSETTPTPQRSPRDTGEAEGGRGGVEPEEGDGPDVLLLALLTTGVAAAASVVALIGYFVRQRIGFSPHRPPERRDGDEPHN